MSATVEVTRVPDTKMLEVAIVSRWKQQDTSYATVWRTLRVSEAEARDVANGLASFGIVPDVAEGSVEQAERLMNEAMAKRNAALPGTDKENPA